VPGGGRPGGLEGPPEEDEASDPQPLSFVVGADEAGQRLDRTLAGRLPALGRRAAAALCAAGAVKVGGRPAHKARPLVQGEHVRVEPDALSTALGEARPAPELPLVVLLERADLLVVDKPAGIPSGALRGRVGGTLAGALLARYPELARVGADAREPGLVHRLDTETSGVVLAARTRASFSYLSDALRRGALEKRYLAIAPAVLPEEGAVRAALEPDPSDARRVRLSALGTLDSSGAPKAERTTYYRVLEVRRGWALVELRCARAYRHQLRAHLASLGAPLAGDATYGTALPGLSPRHALHASRIAGTAPDGTPFRAESPLPPDLAAFWESPPSR
jgi:23S rRNA pseudouridine1911/1915/1917 synthase